MGYEVELVICEPYFGDDGGHSVIATIDLSKPGQAVLDVIRKGTTDPSWYYYADDGNTEIRTDRYDEAIRAVDPNALIAAMAMEGLDYRRFRMAIPLLLAAMAGFDKLRVFAFGH